MLRSSIDWTLFSASDIRKTIRLFDKESEGVRDELGFLAVHQYFSDMFFPGTSVQHTRLRYMLFVPWALQHIIEHSDRKPVRQQLEKLEKRVTLNLIQDYQQKEGIGIIGANSYNHTPQIPPSLSYWSALKRWEVVKFDRANTLDHVERRSRKQASDDDGDILEDHHEALFNYNLPKCPGKLFDSTLVHTGRPKAAMFLLRKPEQRFVYKQISSLQPIDPYQEYSTQSKSLFALLANYIYCEDKKEQARRATELTEFQNCWDLTALSSELELEETLITKLAVASQASSLCYIGRALYWATVETLHNADKSITPGEEGDKTTRHQEKLKLVVQVEKTKALRFDIDEDMPSRFFAHAGNHNLRKVLKSTREWLLSDEPIDGERLRKSKFYPVFRDAEIRRKGNRSKLKIANKSNRKAANITKTPLAYPLNYRWTKAQQFLRDLVNQGER
jgi:hypothetical protein